MGASAWVSLGSLCYDGSRRRGTSGGSTMGDRSWMPDDYGPEEERYCLDLVCSSRGRPPAHPRVGGHNNRSFTVHNSLLPCRVGRSPSGEDGRVVVVVTTTTITTTGTILIHSVFGGGSGWTLRAAQVADTPRRWTSRFRDNNKKWICALLPPKADGWRCCSGCGRNPAGTSGTITTMKAAGKGHLHVLQWAREQGCPWSEWTCVEAARGGHLETLCWLREQGCPWDSKAFDAAVLGKDEKVLEFILAGGIKGSANATLCAAWVGLERLKWVREHAGCEWNDRCMTGAAIMGHLDVLKWAREQGCPWDPTVCSNAAGSGHLHVLQWAREHECPWDARTFAAAARFGDLPLLRWLRDRGCPWDRETIRSAEAVGFDSRTAPLVIELSFSLPL